MGKKSPHYVTITVKGKPFAFSLNHVIYRDKLGRFAKFNSRRKLKVEVYAKTEAVSKKTGQIVQKIRRINKYTLGFAKRKKPTTLKSISRKAFKSVVQHKGKLVKIDGLYKFVYPGQMPKSKNVVKIKKGVFNEYFKTFQASLQ